MKIDKTKIKKILVDGSYVSADDFVAAEKYAKSHGTTVVEYLLSEGLVTNDLLGQAVAESYGLPYADLNSNEPSREQVLRIPEEIATKYRVVVFSDIDNVLTVTTDGPDNPELSGVLKQIFPSGNVRLAFSLTEDIDQVFLHYQKPLETRFSKIIKEQKRVAPEILEEVFDDAYTFQASDIHFEPQRKDVIVRFRVDGVLREAGRIPKEYYENILNRIKVQSRLRIDEHFATQDGSMRHETDGQAFDLRTSIVPTVEGEKVVLRLLAAYVQGFGLADLGLNEENQRLLEEAAQKPFGMIIVSGPTGSGKTTSLYAVLRTLNHPEVNITTIEDPVEYKLMGANQIQVNRQTNLTFAQGLRSIVRQDPDIILVGEIRDEETAEIAVNASLTGHLLLSTFHANDAATVVPRLLDMEIEPFLLSSTLELIIAQRLVRKICDHCRVSQTVDTKDLLAQFPRAKNYLSDDQIRLYEGKGCDVCGHSGFKGRTAIFEMIKITPELQDLILTNPSTKEVWELARSQGSRSLFEDGLDKVNQGVTSLDELLRIAPPPR